MDLPADGEARLAPFVCPDCDGPLNVSVASEGDFLSFQCAVGHRYSLASLVEGKEERLEQIAWTMYRAIDELARMLESVLGLDDRPTAFPAAPAAEAPAPAAPVAAPPAQQQRPQASPPNAPAPR